MGEWFFFLGGVFADASLHNHALRAEAAIALRQRLNETVEALDALKKEHVELETKFDNQKKELTIAKSDRKSSSIEGIFPNSPYCILYFFSSCSQPREQGSARDPRDAARFGQ